MITFFNERKEKEHIFVVGENLPSSVVHCGGVAGVRSKLRNIGSRVQ